jgi:hypothetical protein
MLDMPVGVRGGRGDESDPLRTSIPPRMLRQLVVGQHELSHLQAQSGFQLGDAPILLPLHAQLLISFSHTAIHKYRVGYRERWVNWWLDTEYGVVLIRIALVILCNRMGQGESKYLSE